MDPASNTQLVDGRGRSISTAILYEVVRALRELTPGDGLRVRADPLPAVDSDMREYVIRKASEVRKQPAWAMVISNPGLEELLSPLGFALGAALGGSAVALYFQGPAVRVLTGSFSEGLAGWRRPFSGFARRGLERAGHPPPHEKLRQLEDLGAQIYICGPSMEHFKVATEDLFLAAIRVAAYPTFVAEMNGAGVQVFLQ
jgi:predicted peroxiredoxin